MLDNLIKDFEKYKDVSFIKKEEQNKKGYILQLNTDKEIFIEESTNGIYFHAAVCSIDTNQIPSAEDFYSFLMKANYLGQGTSGGALSLNPDEKSLTLSMLIAYEINYKMFFDLLEDFVNYLFFWEKEISRKLKT